MNGSSAESKNQGPVLASEPSTKLPANGGRSARLGLGPRQAKEIDAPVSTPGSERFQVVASDSVGHAVYRSIAQILIPSRVHEESAAIMFMF